MCEEYLASLTRTTRPSKPTQKMSQIKNTCCSGTATVCDEYLPRRRADGGGDDDDYGFPACVKDCSVACLQDGDETCADDCSDDDAATACAMCEGYGFDVSWLLLCSDDDGGGGDSRPTAAPGLTTAPTPGDYP